MGTELPSGQGMAFDENSFVELPLTNVNSAVVPVLVVGTGFMKCIGTAFNIVPAGLFVTARHVLDEVLKVQSQNPGSYVAVLWVGSGEDEDDVPDLLGGLVHITLCSKDDVSRSDIALLRGGVLKNGEPFGFPTVKLSSRIPAVEKHISGVGYSKFDVESDKSTQQQRIIEIDQSFHFTSGQITQVHLDSASCCSRWHCRFALAALLSRDINMSRYLPFGTKTS